MNDNSVIVKTLCEIDLLVVKRKLKACDKSTKTNKGLHIEMLNAEKEVLEEFLINFN